MKAEVKPEYAGQEHPTFGLLLPGVVYEVESYGELFQAPPKPIKPKQGREE